VSKRRKGGRPPAAKSTAARSRGAGRLRRPPAGTAGGPGEGTDQADARQRRERKHRDLFTPRPFAGLADEPEWVALRELVPAATAPLTLKEEYGERKVTLATLLPMAWPALSRADGEILVGLQRNLSSGDGNRDVAAAILAALATEPGGTVPAPEPAEGPRLADVIVDGELDVTVHDGFDFWVDEADPDQTVAASLERANEQIFPTVRMPGARGAYWCQVPERAHVRWVLPELEDTALTALARLSAAGELKLRADTRFAGIIRTLGALIPVWDLPRELPAGEWDEPFAALAKRYEEALAVSGGLDNATRRARHGLIGRQLTV
jgi:Family of unknown function (DUF5926)